MVSQRYMLKRFSGLYQYEYCFCHIFYWCLAPIGRSIMAYSLKLASIYGLSNTKAIFQFQLIDPEICAFKKTKKLFSKQQVFYIVKVMWSPFYAEVGSADTVSG